MGVAAATVLVVTGAVAAFGVLFAMGANDVANAIGVAISSGALNTVASFTIAAVFEFIGASFGGERVSASIAENISPGLAQEAGSAESKQIFAVKVSYKLAQISLAGS